MSMLLTNHLGRVSALQLPDCLPICCHQLHIINLAGQHLSGHWQLWPYISSAAGWQLLINKQPIMLPGVPQLSPQNAGGCCNWDPGIKYLLGQLRQLLKASGHDQTGRRANDAVLTDILEHICTIACRCAAFM